MVLLYLCYHKYKNYMYLFIQRMDTNMEQLLTQYIQSLNEKEQKAYLIAKSHLGTSFNLQKSNGFIQWAKTNNINILSSSK